jgi:ABC-type antimicrobial peptide transport system permease subunit
VAVISNTAANRYWAGENPIGQQFSFDLDNPDQPVWTVVGVVGDVRSLDLTTETWPEAYFPLAQWPRNTVTVMLRAGSDPSGLVPALRREVSEIDPELPIYYVEKLQDRMDRYLSSDRFYLLLLGIFASMAMTLAAVGLYGVVAYLVSRRTREIGIRVALGAERGEVVRLVLRQSLGPVVLGALVGLTVALAGGGVLSGLLYQVEPWDPPTYIGGTILFMGVAFLATVSPARSATRISPTEAMRVE